MGDLDEPRFARVKIPVGAGVRRFIPLPTRPGERKGKRVDRFVPLLEVIRHNLADLFPGVKISEQAAFRVTRSAGVQRDDIIEAGTGSLMRTVEEDLKQRRFAKAVRLELEDGASQEMRLWLLDKLNLVPQDVNRVPGDEVGRRAGIEPTRTPQPGVEVGLQLVDGTVDLLAEGDAVELVEHGAVEPLAEVSFRATRIASASRVNSSTTHSIRNFRPSRVRSSTKS